MSKISASQKIQLFKGVIAYITSIDAGELYKVPYLLHSYRTQIHISPLSIAPTTTIGREDIWSLGIWTDVFPFRSKNFFSLGRIIFSHVCF